VALVKILPVLGTRVLAHFRADVLPEDDTGCAALLKREAAARRLGPAKDLRLLVRDDRTRRWTEHRP
jgi:hypothetical protein